MMGGVSQSRRKRGVEGPADVARVIDVERILDQVQGDMALLRRVVGLFREQSTGLLADGRRAIEEDGAGIGAVAHALKGMVGHFSSGSPLVAAASLEEDARRGKVAALRDRWRTVERSVGEVQAALEAFVVTAEGGGR